MLIDHPHPDNPSFKLSSQRFYILSSRQLKLIIAVLDSMVYWDPRRAGDPGWLPMSSVAHKSSLDACALKMMPLLSLDLFS